MRLLPILSLLIPFSAHADDPIRSTNLGGANVDDCGSLVTSGLNDALSIRAPGLIATTVRLLNDPRGTNRLTLSYTIDGEGRSYEIDASAGLCDWDAVQNPDGDRPRDTVVFAQTPDLDVAFLMELSREIDITGDEDVRTLTFPVTIELRNPTLFAINDAVVTWSAFPSGTELTGETYTATNADESRAVAVAVSASERAAVGIVDCSGGQPEFSEDLSATTPGALLPTPTVTSDAIRWQSAPTSVPASDIVPFAFGVVASISAAGSEVSIDNGIFAACDRDDDDDTDEDLFLESFRGGSDCDDDDPSTGHGQLHYFDADGDGFGNPDDYRFLCAPADGYVVVDDGDLDCDDTNPDINSGVDEIPGNAIDENCDFVIECYADDDEDGFGGEATVISEDFDCDDDGESQTALDCDDDDADISPNASELPGNLIDEDCDGAIACYADGDGDGFGTAATLTLSFDADCDGDGQSPNDDDCDDTDPAINPAADEIVGNEVDEDCDGRAQQDSDVDTDSDSDEDTEVIDPPDVAYWAGGRSRCSSLSINPALGGFALILIGLLTRRRSTASEVN